MFWLSDDEYARVREKIAPHFSEDGFAGYSLPDGWVYLVEELHDCLVQVDPDYRVGQVKEKFGGLRFYIEYKHPNPSESPVSNDEYMAEFERLNPNREELAAVVAAYEKLSFSVCQYCGNAPAETRDASWVVTLCDSCWANRPDNVQY